MRASACMEGSYLDRGPLMWMMCPSICMFIKNATMMVNNVKFCSGNDNFKESKGAKIRNQV